MGLFVENPVLKNFAKFPEKHMYQIFFKKIADRSLQLY